MTDRHGDGVSPGLFVLTVLPTAGAALLAWLVLFPDRPLWTTLAVVVGAVVAGVLVALLLVRPQPSRAAAPVPREARRPAADGWSSEPRASLPPAPERTPAQPDRRAVEGHWRETAQLVLPVDGAAPAGRWWSQDTVTPRAPVATSGAPARPSPRDLAELRDSARVVQCPRCGAFRIDVTHVGTGYAFRCRVDHHEWTWRPGTAWPVTVVASRRRTGH